MRHFNPVVRRCLRATLATTTILALAHPARAAEDQTAPPTATAPVTLDEIDVTASPIETTATPIPASERLATGDTASLLKKFAGVSLYSAGGFSSLPAIHGLADDRLKILVDGMETTSACPNHMNPALSYIAPTKVETIDVMAGITPVSAGGDSIGGTIVVESAKPTFAAAGEGLHTEGSLSTVYRSSSHGISTSGNVSAATEHYSLGYTGSWTRASDYHRGGDNAPVRTSAYQVEDHALKLGVRQDGQLFTVEGGYQFSPYEGFPNQRMDLTENLSKFLNLRHNGEFGWGTLDSQAYWRSVTHEMNFLDKIKGTNMPMNTEAQDIGYKLKAEIPLNARDTVRIGNELSRFTLDDWWPPTSTTAGGWMSPNDFYNIHDGERTRLGTFAEWQRKWDTRWTTMLGARNDTVWMNTGDVQGYSDARYGTDSAAFNAQDHAKTDVNFDLTAQVRYEHDKTSTYEAGYARKTRSPNLYERYAWSTGTMASNMNTWFGDGNGYVGDVDLKPEVAHTLSVSTDWHDSARKSWSITVKPYYTYVEDYIDADVLTVYSTGFRKLKFANHDAILYGADISGSLALWENPVSGTGGLNGTLSWVNGQNLDTGDNLYNVMPLSARISLDHRLGGWTNQIEVEMAASKNGVSHTRNELETPAYALLNLRTGYQWDNLALTLGVENVFNHLYYEPLGGVYYSENRSRYSNVPGEGRTFVAGATIKF